LLKRILGQVPVLLAMLIHGADVEMLGDLSDRPLLDKMEGEIAALNDVILQQCNSCVDSSIGFTLHGHIRAEGGDGGGVGVGNVSGNFSIRSVKCSPLEEGPVKLSRPRGR